MKIVVDVRTMGSKPSGIGIYAFYYLKEMLKSNYELVLLTDVEASEEINYMRKQGVEIISFGKNVYRSAQVFQYFAFVRKQLERLQPDLFWEPNILIPGSLGQFKGKVMITIHDMFPVSHVQYFGWKYALYFRVMLRQTIRKTDIVLYNSIETKEESERFFPSLRNKKHYIQYVIVPRIKIEHKSGDMSIRETAMTKDYFLYLGNMEKRKGVDLLLDAYELYRQKGGTKALVLAGKSREQDIDEKTAAMTDKYEDVIYYGYVSEEDKQCLYENCSCFLFPSMAEGFGICVLEAMNYYKPIIVSDLSIFKEIVGECICYFSLGGNRKTQINNLTHILFEFDTAVDRAAYDEVMERYMPKKLGEEMLCVLDQEMSSSD